VAVSLIALVRRRAAAGLAVVLIALGGIAATARLDGPSDGTVVPLGRSSWQAAGVVVDVPGGLSSSTLRPGDLVTTISGRHLADGFGGVAAPSLGDFLPYQIAGDPAPKMVQIIRTDPYPLLQDGWGNLVFVVALAALAVALHLRRPDEPATTPLLVGSAGLLGSTLSIVFGLPALSLATVDPSMWLFHLNTIVAYSLSWGAGIAFSLLCTAEHPWMRRRRLLLGAAYLAPLGTMAIWIVLTRIWATNSLQWLGLIGSGQTAVVIASLIVVIIAVLVAYRRSADPLARSRLRWLAGGSAVTIILGLAGWHLPELITGQHALPSGALGLSGLPFVVALGVALRRHQLFGIERLANRSLVYAAVVAVLVAGYAGAVAVLVSGLRISGTVAAAIAAAGAALALAPLRNVAQRVVNRLMYGDRDDPTAVLSRLGGRLQAVMLPGDVLPAVVETVGQSLRVPYVAIDLTDPGGGFRTAAEHGAPIGTVHSEPLLHHGVTVGRLRVSDRGRDDPLNPDDLSLIRSLGQQVGPAVQAVRLHEDLVRSRAEVVALREDERRRLRRDLHDGLGPALAAIGLKAGLAARQLPSDSAARGLLGEITTEVKSGLGDIRRLVEALRPPALDELGLLGALKNRAASLAGDLAIEVSGEPEHVELPAAVETAAYWIAIEAMTNAARHSGGRCCRVSVLIGERELVLTAQDDGRGLDPAGRTGVGLRSMRERAAEVGGTLSLRSAPEGGTIVEARIPLELGERSE
jgi:signal transduction histidine kinase